MSNRSRIRAPLIGLLGVAGLAVALLIVLGRGDSPSPTGTTDVSSSHGSDDQTAAFDGRSGDVEPVFGQRTNDVSRTTIGDVSNDELPTFVVRGRVLDVSRTPVIGATVVVRSLTGEEDTFTNADGRFRISLSAYGPARLMTVHDERWTGLNSIPVGPSNTGAELVLFAASWSTVDGRVVSPRGEGLSGGTISVVDSELTAGLFAELLATRLRTKTDETGAFRIERVPVLPGQSLFLRLPGRFASLALDDGPRSGIRWELPEQSTSPTVTVKGVVVDAGERRISGAEVRALGRSTTTTRDGRFELEIPQELVSGEDAIVASKSGEGAGHARIPLPPPDGGPVEVDVRIRGLAEVTGTLVRTDGTPVDGALLTLTDGATRVDLGGYVASLEFLASGGRRVRTDADGRFDLTVLEGTEYVVSAEVSRRLLAEPCGTVSSGDSNFELVLDDTHALGETRIRLVNPDGEAVAGASVQLRKSKAIVAGVGGFYATERVVSSDDGQCVFHDIDTLGAEVVIQVSSGDEVVFPIDHKEHDHVVLVAPRRTMTVRWSKDPESGRVLRLVDPDGAALRFTLVERTGRAYLERLVRPSDPRDQAIWTDTRAARWIAESESGVVVGQGAIRFDESGHCTVTL